MGSGIYVIQNKINKKAYIGQSIRLKYRKKQHLIQLRNNRHYNSHLQNAYNIYGENNFTFRVLCECPNEELSTYEQFFIKLYDSYHNGYNMTEGGEICPDNIDEKHGMWRHDIHSELLRRMYIEGKSTTELGKIFKCSRRTIERRLHKVMDEEYLRKIRYERSSKSLKGRTAKKGDEAYNYRGDVPSGKELYHEFKEGTNQTDLAKKYNCSQATISYRILEYTETLPETFIRRTKTKKDFWDRAVVEYCKADMCRGNKEPNPCSCFVFKLNGIRYTDIRSKEWLSFEIIADLVEEILQEENMEE